MTKLVIINTHPVNYHVPIYRALSQLSGVDVEVFFLWGDFLENYKPKEEWPMQYSRSLLTGYKYRFIKNHAWQRGEGFLSFVNWSLFRLIQRSQCDAILLFGYDSLSTLFVSICAKIHRIPVIFKGEANLTQKEYKFKNIFRSYYLKCFFSSIEFFTYSYEKNKLFFMHYGVHEKQLHFMPCAVDNVELQTRASDLCKHELKLRFGFEGKKIILFSGRLESRKSPDKLLSAFKEVALTNSDVMLIFVGEGVLKPHLMQLSKQMGIEDFVLFTGFLSHDDINLYYKIADIFVLPSEQDPSPKVLNEVMNFGVPVIVSDHVGTAGDLVKHNENGLIYPYEKISVLSEYMGMLLKDDRLYQKLASNTLPILSDWTIGKDADSIQTILNIIKNRAGKL